jgi:nucleoside-diphosphate-sugar epimerase
MGKSKILVTGGLGFIGHRVVHFLERLGHDVVIADTRTTYGIIPQAELDYVMSTRLPWIQTQNIHRIDIADAGGIDYLMRVHQPNCVIHLASFPRQKAVNANPQLGSRAMSEGLLNLLEHSKRHGVQKFVYVSSSMVYGEFEDDTPEWVFCEPRGQYGIMKLAGEWLVKDYHRRGSFDYAIVRPSAVYGPGDVEDRVVSRFLLAAHRGEVLHVHGAAEALDFTYVDDTASGIVAAAVAEPGNIRVFNITRGRSRTLLEAAELAVRIAGRGSIEVVDRDPDYPQRGALRITTARQHLGFNPQTDIEQGFQTYYDWLANSLYWSPKTVS